MVGGVVGWGGGGGGNVVDSTTAVVTNVVVVVIATDVVVVIHLSLIKPNHRPSFKLTTEIKYLLVLTIGLGIGSDGGEILVIGGRWLRWHIC